MPMDDFPIRTYTKKELALCYFPDSTPHTAVNHLMSWINRNKGLTDELTKLGYIKSQREFLPRQVMAIIDYLGAP